MTSTTSRRAHFIGISIIALAVLAYQVLLTRIFSVVFYYHFAFAGITLAMLGLTVGAIRVYGYSSRYTPARMQEEWARAAIGLSLISVLCYALCLLQTERGHND